MRIAKICCAALPILLGAAALYPHPGSGTISGKVTYTGKPAKPKPINMSAQPECIKLHPNGLYSEDVLTGSGDTLENVLVYISAGDTDPGPVPATAATFDQKDCHYTTHVLPLRVGQDVSISNSDPFNHNIHPLAKINREWNRIQLPGTPPFSYSYDNEEFISVKCNIHAWMRAYFHSGSVSRKPSTSFSAPRPTENGRGLTGRAAEVLFRHAFLNLAIQGGKNPILQDLSKARNHLHEQ